VRRHVAVSTCHGLRVCWIVAALVQSILQPFFHWQYTLHDPILKFNIVMVVVVANRDAIQVKDLSNDGVNHPAELDQTGFACLQLVLRINPEFASQPHALPVQILQLGQV
jgi:hypothetical protein